MAILISLLYIFRFQIFYTIVLYNENYITNLHAHACVCLYVYIHKCEQSEMKKLIFVLTGEERTHFFGSVTVGSGSLQEKEPIRISDSWTEGPAEWPDARVVWRHSRINPEWGYEKMRVLSLGSTGGLQQLYEPPRTVCRIPQNCLQNHVHTCRVLGRGHPYLPSDS